MRSLVCEHDDGRLAGFLAVYARRILIDGRRALAACSGPLLADPAVNVVAPGLLLTRAYLAGPQELSVTDGANDVMSRMWVRVGGVVAQLPSLGLDSRARAVLVRRRNGRRSSIVIGRQCVALERREGSTGSPCSPGGVGWPCHRHRHRRNR